jgi:hypothetical protein
MGKGVASLAELIDLGRHSQKSSSIVLGYIEPGHAGADNQGGSSPRQEPNCNSKPQININGRTRRRSINLCMVVLPLTRALGSPTLVIPR